MRMGWEWVRFLIHRLVPTFYQAAKTSSLFIGPESDHWLCLSLSESLTHSRFVKFIDVTLACEDAYSKLAEVVTVAYVDDENSVGDSFLQIWKLRFGHFSFKS